MRRNSSTTAPDSRSLPDRLLVVAESDSYLKWAAHLVGRLQVADVDVLVLEGPSTPSGRQCRVAVEKTDLEEARLRRATALVVRRHMRSGRFGTVLLACTGPTVALLTVAVRRRRNRPVLVCGIPGVALPASDRAVVTRSRCDVHIVHSLTERDVFTDRYRQAGARTSVKMTSLPMLARNAMNRTVPSTRPRIVFAPQPSVPPLESERRRLIELLAATSDDPVVVKLRAAGNEQTTHDEPHSYTRLITDLGLADHFEFSYRSMADELAGARCLVTVSSTAAIEAIDLGVPVVIVGDFGVRPDLLNEVFDGSGLVHDLDASSLAADQRPDDGWAERNYFHDSGLDDATGDPRCWATPLDTKLRPRFSPQLWRDVAWSASRLPLLRSRAK